MTDNLNTSVGIFTYTRRLVAVLAVIAVIGAKLCLNSEISDSFLLMAGLLGLALPMATYFALRAILRKEDGRWISWGYFMVLVGVVSWALIMM